MYPCWTILMKIADWWTKLVNLVSPQVSDLLKFKISAKNLGKTIKLDILNFFTCVTLILNCSLDINVMEVDFLETFAKIADPLDGLLTAKQFANYLQLPVDHPKTMELFQIYDTVRKYCFSATWFKFLDAVIFSFRIELKILVSKSTFVVDVCWASQERIPITPMSVGPAWRVACISLKIN